MNYLYLVNLAIEAPVVDLMHLKKKFIRNILCFFYCLKGTVNVTGDGAIKKVLKDYNKYAYPGTTDHPIVKITHALNPVKMDYVSS